MKQRALDSPWKLYKSAWGDYRRHWKAYIKILAVAVVPVSIISANASPALRSPGSITNMYCELAIIIMNVAFLWAVFQRRQTGKMPTLAQAYYDGSVAIVRYLLVLGALIFMAFPAGFGAGLYYASVVIGGNVSPWGQEQLLMGSAALLVSIPTFWLMMRYVMSFVIVVKLGLRPVAALRRSRSLTLGRFWRVAGRLMALPLMLLPVLLAILALTVGLELLGANGLSGILLQVLSTLILLPVAEIYVINLYEQLEKLAESKTQTQPLPETMEAAV